MINLRKYRAHMGDDEKREYHSPRDLMKHRVAELNPGNEVNEIHIQGSTRKRQVRY
ncbi:MAG: hypothetical protein AABW82_01695 [Nanoarchaeota archaeon]